MIAASLPDRRQVEFGERVVTDQRPSAPSPRVRGEQLDLRFADAEQGSIPACAGETPGEFSYGTLHTVHPRVCGGKRIQKLVFGGSPGSIPACAGETSPPFQPPSSTRVHPRVCGGNMECPRLFPLVYGPSPRVRGKRIVKPASGFQIGSIPACAGETYLLLSVALQKRVHPRVCGGNAS